MNVKVKKKETDEEKDGITFSMCAHIHILAKNVIFINAVIWWNFFAGVLWRKLDPVSKAEALKKYCH